MTDEFVVLRTVSNGDPAEVGTVVKQAGGEYTVRWTDGRQETLRLNMSLRLAQRGTLRFESLVEPMKFKDRFRRDPVGVVLDVLREARKPLRTAPMKDALVVLELEKSAVDEVWPMVKKVIEKHPNVQKMGKPPAYLWTSEAVDPFAVLRAIKPVDAVNRLHSGNLGEEERAILRTVVEAAAPHDAVLGTIARAVGVEALNSAPWPDPIAAIAELDRFDDAAIEAALSRDNSGSRMDARRTAAFLAKGRRGRSGWPLGVVAGERLREVVDVFVESMRSAPTRDEKFRRAVEVFLSRLIDSGSIADLGPDRLLRLWLEASSAVSAKDTRLTDDLTGELANVFSALDGGTLDWPAIQRAAGRLPVTKDGGRARLLAEVGRKDPQRLQNPEWWRGAELDDLAAAAGGRLGQVLSDGATADIAIRPLLVKSLAEASGRVQLARLIGYPNVVTRLIRPNDLAAAFRRCADSDAVLSTWLHSLSGTDDRLELEARVERAEADAQSAAERAAAAEDVAADLRGRLTALDARLRDQHNQTVELRAGQQRQARIDVLRVLAELAVQTHLTSGESAAEVAATVESIVAPHGLQRIGLPEEHVDYDPGLHELVVPNAKPGDQVLVVRPGYLLHEPYGDNVIAKALVRQ